MPNITSDQALQIGKMLSDFAKAVENYRFAHFAQLTDLQEASLRNAEDHLRTISNNVLDMGINLVLDNAQGAINGLTEVTARLNRDLTTLTDINKALGVVAVLLQIGTALGTGNPTAIASALQSALSTLA